MRKTVARGHDYFVLETWEAGIELRGTEVKSIRLGKCALKDCYAAVKNGELFVYGMHISPYEKGSFSNTDPLRPKKLLMHKSEIRKLHQGVMQKGLALIPLSVYLKDGRMKVEIALCRGKKTLRQTRRHGQARRAERHRPQPAREGIAGATWGRIWFRRGYGEPGKRAAALNRLKNGKLKMN